MLEATRKPLERATESNPRSQLEKRCSTEARTRKLLIDVVRCGVPRSFASAPAKEREQVNSFVERRYDQGEQGHEANEHGEPLVGRQETKFDGRRTPGDVDLLVDGADGPDRRGTAIHRGRPPFHRLLGAQQCRRGRWTVDSRYGKRRARNRARGRRS